MTTITAVQNGLDRQFAALRTNRELALVMYQTAGYPDPATNLAWAPLLADSGATILELGVPFSDPLGDGPTVQRSSQQALDAGMTVGGAFDLAAKIAAATTIPLVIMTYCNPVFRMGLARFAERAAAAGIAGVIVPDLPIEEADELAAALARVGVHLIYMLSPTSTEERITRTAAAASGFIYCMALTGVTGARASLSGALPDFLRRVRALTEVPLVVGFGISRPEHLRALAGLADGAVVASALIDLIDRTEPEGRAAAISEYVRELRASCSVS
ncbi:MAG TPA: tryptophan synthase subunit alpha [Chloroflexota bacterium]|nr:tryptophan synthase subunit alpha [Chloroflexota bacterium]